MAVRICPTAAVSAATEAFSWSMAVWLGAGGECWTVKTGTDAAGAGAAAFASRNLSAALARSASGVSSGWPLVSQLLVPEEGFQPRSPRLGQAIPQGLGEQPAAVRGHRRGQAGCAAGLLIL